MRCGFWGSFRPPAGGNIAAASSVIARTDRGLEAGEVLCEATPEALGRMKDPGAGQILREMTAEDRHELARMQQQAQQEIEVCQQHIERLGLKMQLVDVEHIFGGERIVIYYLAESRVDFRELVRLLAGEFQTRIEMRQIGVRDEAKLLADYGDCGCPVCCNTHLVQMPPVSMRMAKLQKATLDPTKISGRCGRLKCCLRYEYETYEQTQAAKPRREAEPAATRTAEPSERRANRTLRQLTGRHPTADLKSTNLKSCVRCSTLPIRSPSSLKRIAATRSRPTCSSSRRCTTRRTSCRWGRRARAEPPPEPAAEERGAEPARTPRDRPGAVRGHPPLRPGQYGYMAKTVLNSWGIHGTSDFGEIVFNLIRIGQMRKTPADTRVDFDNVYDFDTAFKQEFKITPRQ